MNRALCFFLLLAVFSCAIVPQYALYQQEYLPAGVEDIYLGMTYKFMEKTRKETSLEPVENSDSTRLVFREVRPGQPFESLTYYFDNISRNQALYELSIDFPAGTDVSPRAMKMYGESNADEGEWSFETPEGFRLTMWVEPAKIFISARELRNQ